MGNEKQNTKLAIIPKADADDPDYDCDRCKAAGQST